MEEKNMLKSFRKKISKLFSVCLMIAFLPINSFAIGSTPDANDMLNQLKAIEQGSLTFSQVTAVTGTDSEKFNKMRDIVCNEVRQSPLSPFATNIANEASQFKVSDFDNIDNLGKPYSSTLIKCLFQNNSLDPANPFTQKSVSADEYPGKVQGNAQRVANKIVSVNLEFRDLSYLRMWQQPKVWRSTGLYAPAGETITIDVPYGVTDVDVQIGCHVDHYYSGKRARNITLKQRLIPGMNEVRSPYGGLIYFIPTRSYTGKTVNMLINGAVKSGRFINGITQEDNGKQPFLYQNGDFIPNPEFTCWVDKNRFPAPWVELQTKDIIVTVPAKYLRPRIIIDGWGRKRIIKYYNQAQEACDAYDKGFDFFYQSMGMSDNNSLPHKIPDRQHRIVTDITATIGAYAGYPMVVNEGSWATNKGVGLISPKVNGSSTIWHELGHNFHIWDWFEWSGLIEGIAVFKSVVVLNQFGYNVESYPLLNYYDAINYVNLTGNFSNLNPDDKDFNITLNNYGFQKGRQYKALMFAQLAIAFGSKFWANWYKSYREFSESQKPANDQQKIDLFVKTACKISGYNLLNFFDKWGLKYSAHVRNAVLTMGFPITPVDLSQLTYREHFDPLPIPDLPGDDTQAPSIPGNLRANVTTSGVNLLWNTSTDNIGVSGYRIYRNNLEIGTTTALNYTDNNVTEAETYIYTVKAYDEAGNISSASNQQSITIPVIPDETWTKKDDNDSSVYYSSGWSTWSGNPGFNRTEHFSKTIGSIATFTFNGTQVRFYSFKRRDLGKAEIYVDDVLKATIDCYSNTPQYDQILFESEVLAPGTHTLKVKVTGTKNALATNTYVICDAFEFINDSGSSSSENIALGKPASSDGCESWNPVANGNDGDITTRWCARDGNVNRWWKVDLGGDYNLTGSEVKWEMSGKVYKYRIEVSTDDNNWIQVIDKTNNTSTKQIQADGFSTTARYVRITVTGLSYGSWASFWEFKVFGKKSQGDIQPPTAPGNLNVSLYKNFVILWWKASTDNKGVSGYRIYRNGIEIGTKTASVYYDYNVTNGKKYTYTVRAYDEAGNLSDESNLMNITVNPW